MVNVAICDDELVELEYISTLVRKWQAARETNVHISQYESAESFIFSLEDKHPIDVIMLDIQMGQMDGVELARQIRKADDTMQIVFITGFPDFVAQGYDVAALHYLIKPVQEEKLFEVLDKAMLRLSRQSRFDTLPKAGGDVRIALGQYRTKEGMWMRDGFSGRKRTKRRNSSAIPRLLDSFSARKSVPQTSCTICAVLPQMRFCTQKLCLIQYVYTLPTARKNSI